MATLSNEARLAGAAKMMSDLSADGEAIAVTKADLRAAFNALDQFLSDNAATINNALPTAAKNGLTVKQKARLLQIVVQHRYLGGF